MDRLNQLRGAESSAGRDAALDASTASEAYMSANESSKYFSLSGSSFDITPIQDVSLASTAADPERTLSEDLMPNLSPITKKDVMLDSFKIGKQIDAATILSGGVDIFDDNDNSFDGDELVIDDNVDLEDKSDLDKDSQFKADENVSEATLIDTPVDVASKDTEVVLQIDGKNVDAIDIGNGLYLYRKEGQEELAAVQIINDDDQQQPSFKFLKVRENAEGNLEVYEEFEIEVTKDVLTNEVKTSQHTPIVPFKNINKGVTESSGINVTDKKQKPPTKEVSSTSTVVADTEDAADSKTNLNGKMMKFSESRKSPVVGSFTPMTYHSTPNKVGKPLTKTMVDLQLHPSRHSDNVKKTIEVHTDSQSKKMVCEEITKQKTESKAKKTDQIIKEITENEIDESKTEKSENQDKDVKIVKASEDIGTISNAESKQVIKERLTDTKLGDKQPDKKIPDDQTEMNVDKYPDTISKKLQSKADTDSFQDDSIKISHNATNAVKNDTAKDAVANAESDLAVNRQQVKLPTPKGVRPEAVAQFLCQTSITKPDEVNNEIPTKLSENLFNVGSTSSGVLEKANKSDEVAAQDGCKTELKKDFNKDVVDNAQSETIKLGKIFDGPEEGKVSAQKCSEATTSSKTDVPLPNQNKDVKQHDEVSSTSTVGLKSKHLQPIDVKSSKIPVTDINKPLYTPAPETNVDTNQQKAKEVQPKVVETLVTKQNESVLNQITKQSGPKIEYKAEKPNVFPKAFELKTVSKVVKLNPSSKPIEFNTLPLPQKPNSENKVEAKVIPITNPTGKAGDVKIMPISKVIESKPILKAEIYNPIAKTVAAEKINSIEKKVDITATVSKIDKQNPVTTVETKTVPKIEKVNVVDKKIDPVNIAKVEKLPGVNYIPKAKDMIIGKSDKNIVPAKTESTEKKVIKATEATSNQETKPINNNHAAVPFGQWTDANRQEFLNKFKDVKAPVTSNTKQIKNSNDLNRIDILKKIDSQRSNNASAKAQSNLKDTVFSSKIAPPKTETKIPVKNEGLKVKAKHPEVTDIKTVPQSSVKAAATVSSVPPVQSSTVTSVATLDIAKEPTERIVNVTDLISKTIIGMLNKAPMPMTNVHNAPVESKEVTQEVKTDPQKLDEDSSGSLDDIEMKMNELHGIPFVERPPHELPKLHKTYGKSKDVVNKVPKKQSPAATSKQSLEKDVIDIDSDDEVIEHEPITGDIDQGKKSKVADKTTTKSEPKREPVITENDFDKFAGKNSIAFENCLTVKFDGKEVSNVVQSVKEKDAVAKHYPGNKMIRMEPKTKLPPKQTTSQINPKVPNTGKFGIVPEDPSNKNYQSKIASAYQSALNSKRQMDRPITIIEDKPVKVVFMDANSEFVPNKLNVQGKELSPAKKAETIDDSNITKNQPSVSNVTLAVDDNKQQDDTKTKTKHQRKQVLTPVEAPELVLIQPGDLCMDVSPKKKRKTEDNRTDKSLKNLVHKKQYLLGRSAAADDKNALPQEQNHPKETAIHAEVVTERSAVSAIDNLVKAAELLENQTQMKSIESTSPNSDSQQSSPIKRGRGRPRKYPLPEGATSPNKVVSPSPQKKPRLIDAKPVKQPDPLTDEDISEGEEMIRENWTMGKINENIVCPICNKLFRSENVVFKHVKHCTGVSPSRSDSEKLSPRRMRLSRDSDNKSIDSQSEDMEKDEKPIESPKSTPKKRISKEISKVDSEVIVIEETPVKEHVSKTAEETYEQPETGAQDNTDKIEDKAEEKTAKVKKLPKTHTAQMSSNLDCEFCGKTFRQLSYLVNHKLQHKKEQSKKLEAVNQTSKLQVFSCEVCKKVFRKLHHLVQHRIIHNPEVPTRTTRKSSSEHTDIKSVYKSVEQAPKSEDPSAGFRCEPCDKSFRKLHHLVEHRETHDGINRQKSTNAQTVIEKPPPPPQCDVCKKTFRKLHHLIEHKEQHVEQVETSSDKSDDKSVKSSLSTKDIIHECSLCYMVFPNEHSLTKHFVFCQQKKKRQSKAKEKQENVDGNKMDDGAKSEDSVDEDGSVAKIVAEEMVEDNVVETEQGSNNVVPDTVEENKVNKPVDVVVPSSDADKPEVSEVPVKEETPKLISTPAKRDLPKSDSPETKEVVPEKIKKIDDQPVKIKKLPKKTPTKEKVASSETKRQKNSSLLAVQGVKPQSSDDDEVRYMLNPNFKTDENIEGKAFMKVRSHKRNSLQIERPSSRDLMKRRTSLQHPPKISRLKKATQPKLVPTKSILKLPKLESVSTDSDDSEVKYSFPKPVQETLVSDENLTKKGPRKSLAEKRKSLGGIAKRKSLGQALASKLKANLSPVRIIKRRTLDVEHRCDCGQLFNSAALLTRHTSLAHTPPRIRRRRSPPPPPPPPAPIPDPASKPDLPAKPTRQISVATNSTKPTRKSSVASNPTSKPARKSSVASNSASKPTRKSSVASNSASKPTRKSSIASNSASKPTRKSSVASNSASKPSRKSSVTSNSARKSSAKSETPDSRKSAEKSQVKSSVKTKRNAAHSGVPVPEKMRKLMVKNAK